MGIFDYGAFGEATEANTDSYGFDETPSSPDPRSEGFPDLSNVSSWGFNIDGATGTGGPIIPGFGGVPFDTSKDMGLNVLPPGLTAEDLKNSGISFEPTGEMSVDSVLGKLKSVANTLGLTQKDGSYDWKKIIGLGAAGLTAYDTLNRKTQPVKTVAELAGSLPSNAPPGFSPEALATMRVPLKAGNQLARQSAASMPSPIQLGVLGYAEGGDVEGALSQAFDSSQQTGQVAGDGGGQDDMVEARLSPGEYVFDAESVSMLGDGDNAAGARKLDELRAAMRAHKRSAPPDEIAPRSLGPLSYMKGGSNG